MVWKQNSNILEKILSVYHEPRVLQKHECINSLDSRKTKLLLFPLYGWESWGTEKLNILSEVLQIMSESWNPHFFLIPKTMPFPPGQSCSKDQETVNVMYYSLRPRQKLFAEQPGKWCFSSFFSCWKSVPNQDQPAFLPSFLPPSPSPFLLVIHEVVWNDVSYHFLGSSVLSFTWVSSVSFFYLGHYLYS